MSAYTLKILEIFVLPLFILASVVGLTVWYRQQKDRGIIVLLFILTTLIAFGISLEYKKLTAQELITRTSPIQQVGRMEE
jgi:hypothetical protein